MERSQRQHNFLQKLIANRGNTTIPLVYPEAMAFPSIFWDSMFDGSVIGAIPTVLLVNAATLKRFGYVTLHNQFQTRLMDTSLLTSTDF